MQENEFDDLFSRQLNRLPPPDFSERDWREVENKLIIKKLQRRLTLFGWALPLLGVASMAISGGLYYQLRQTHRELEQLKKAAATVNVKPQTPVEAPRSQVVYDTSTQRVAARLPDKALPAQPQTVATTSIGIVPVSTAPTPILTNSIPDKATPKATPFDTTTTPQITGSTLPELRVLTPKYVTLTPSRMPPQPRRVSMIQSPTSQGIPVPQTEVASTRREVSPAESVPDRPVAVPEVSGQKKSSTETAVPNSTEKSYSSADAKANQRTASNRRKNRSKTSSEQIDLPKSTPETVLADRTGSAGLPPETPKKLATPPSAATALNSLPQQDQARTETSATLRQEPPKTAAIPLDTSSQVAKATKSETTGTGDSTQGTIRRAGQAAPFSFRTILKFTSVGLQVGLPANAGYGFSAGRGTVVGLQAGVRVGRHWQVFADVSSQAISPETNLKRPLSSIPINQPNGPDFKLERFRVNHLKFTNVGAGVNFVVTDRFLLQPYVGLGWNLQVPRRYDVEYEFRQRSHRPPIFTPRPRHEERTIYVRERFESRGIHQFRIQGGLQYPVWKFLLINVEGFWNTQGRRTPTLTDTSGWRLGLSYRF